MPTLPQPRFYVYALARPIKNDWRIFYIGKGSKRRVFDHEAKARGTCRCHKCSIIRKVWREGGEIQRYILLTTDDEQEALDYEMELIALHGRENLCNHTDGGEGASGIIVSAETRAKLRVAIKRGLSTPESRAKRSALTKASWQNPEVRQRRQEGLQRVFDAAEKRTARGVLTKAQWNDPEIRQRRSEGIVAASKNPDVHARHVAAGKKRWDDADAKAKDSRTRAIRELKASPEGRAQARQQMLDRYADPAERAKTGEQVRKRFENPAERAKLADTHRNRFEDPTEREKVSERNRNRYKDPEARAKMSESLKAMWADPEMRAKMLQARKKRE